MITIPSTPDELRALTHEWEKNVIEYFNPDIEHGTQATHSFPLTGIETMLIAVACYSVIVLTGVVMYCKSSSTGDDKRQGSKEKSKGESWGEVFSGFAAEPIKILQVFYNMFQVFLCGWMVTATIMIWWEENYSVACNKFTNETTRLTYVMYVFYLSKILDFVDTFFIVARGKWSQFSLLHIYHHYTIFVIYWLVINGAYWGDSYYPVIANGFVHFVMYGYYLFTSFGIRVGWGHMVTKLQMVQFVTMIWNGMYILRNSCPFPARLAQLYVVYITSLFVLFARFYVDRWCIGGGEKRKGRGKKN